MKHLLFVGGSGSLEVKPGVQDIDLPSFPAEYKQGALAICETLNMLRQETSLEWSVLAPSADLFSGERTGRFRLGTDQLLREANGESRISLEDFAMTMLNELDTRNTWGVDSRLAISGRVMKPIQTFIKGAVFFTCRTL